MQSHATSLITPSQDMTSPGTMPMAALAFAHEALEGRLEGELLAEPVVLRRFQTTIGRRNADVVLADPDVSRQHALVEKYGDRYLVRDLGSTNGTYVNGKRVDAEMLCPGDVIEVGGTRLVFLVALV